MQVIVRFISLLFFLVLSTSTLQAQDTTTRVGPISAECGDITEGEFTSSREEHFYTISLKAGDSVNVAVVPVGDLLNTAIYLYNTTSELVLAYSDPEIVLADGGKNYTTLRAENRPKMSSPLLSSNSDYDIYVVNYTWLRGGFNAGGIGSYTIYIGCTLRDGTVINPGDTLLGAQPTDQSPIPKELPSNFVGFPGLAPVDFASAFRVSLDLDSPNEGEIPATGNNVLGFKFSANAGDKMDLSFTRVSGNLNLGLVVLSATNQVVYMAALVNSEAMTSRFTLPVPGEYTIGVFRLDLLPPSVPVNTSFQLQVTLSQ